MKGNGWTDTERLGTSHATHEHEHEGEVDD